MDKIIENEIRTLLGRFYGGSTSPADERRLRGLLASATDLPADLEADRLLFAEVGAAAEELPEMPADLDARVKGTLDAVIARDRRVVWRRRLRRLAIGASGAAACLLCVVAAWRGGQDTDIRPVAERVAAVAHEKAGSGRVSPPAVENAAPAIAATAVAGPSATRHTRKAHTSRKATPAPVVSGGDPAVEANYRVIEDEREADLILSSIFGRMEGELALENSRIEEIGIEYDTESAKLCSY